MFCFFSFFFFFKKKKCLGFISIVASFLTLCMENISQIVALRCEKAFFIDGGVPLHSSTQPPRLLDLRVGVFLPWDLGAPSNSHIDAARNSLLGFLVRFICLFVKNRSESGEERDRQQRWGMRQEEVGGTELFLSVKAMAIVQRNRQRHLI